VDLGGVLDHEGKLLGKNNDQNTVISPLVAQRFDKPNVLSIGGDDEDSNRDKNNTKKPRRMSIMGTFGYVSALNTISRIHQSYRYMAPEMVIMLGQTSAEKKGYTAAVYWL